MRAGRGGAHTVRIVSVSAAQSLHMFFQARCSCGWEGPRRREQSRAEEDQIRHGIR